MINYNVEHLLKVNTCILACLYCRHYQEFLGCIKYHALINDEECPVAELDEMVQIIWRRQGLSMCIGKLWCIK